MKHVLHLALTLLLVTMASGCNEKVEGSIDEGEESRAKQAATVRIPVEAELPMHRDISAYFETTARVEAERRVDVMAKGVGQCLSVKVEEGDVVKKDQILAELDKEELLAQLRQTEVQVQQNKFQRDKAKEQLDKGILSSFESENAGYAYNAALATLNLQRVQIANQTIRAPIDGVVTMRGIQPGQLVSSGMPAFSIVDPTSYILPIYPPEKELVNLSVGQEADITIDSRPGDTFAGKVRRINPSVDPTSGTVKVTLDFDESAREFLKEAAFARIKLVMDTRTDALVVPKDTLIEENARQYLMIIEETPADSEDEDAKPVKTAKRVEIETGLEDSDYVEVLSGIDDDSLIVTLGQHTLKPGSEVKITNAEEEILSNIGLSPEEALSRAEAQQFEIPRKQDRREKMLR